MQVSPHHQNNNVTTTGCAAQEDHRLQLPYSKPAEEDPPYDRPPLIPHQPPLCYAKLKNEDAKLLPGHTNFPYFLVALAPLAQHGDRPFSAGNPFAGPNAGERASEGDRDDRHEEEDDRFAYNLHAMCLVCLAFAFAGFFAHTRRDRWRTWWLMMRYRMYYRGRVESSQEEAMTTFGSGIYWHCLCRCAGIFLIHPEDELVSYVCSHADYNVFHCKGGWQDSGDGVL